MSSTDAVSSIIFSYSKTKAQSVDDPDVLKSSKALAGALLTLLLGKRNNWGQLNTLASDLLLLPSRLGRPVVLVVDDVVVE